MPESVFQRAHRSVYEHLYSGTIQFVTRPVGGLPRDEKALTGYLKTKLADNDDLIRQAVAEIMVGLDVNAEEAVEIHAATKVNGFRRDDQGLYLGGYQLKCCIKEGCNIRWPYPTKKWGGGVSKNGNETGKGAKSYFAEHVFVVEDQLHFRDRNGDPVRQQSGIQMRFVQGRYGASFVHEEYIEPEDAAFDFHVETDVKITDDQWAELWVICENQGLGATRALGYGKFVVTKWERES